jgi:hypothetical protein
LLVARVGRDGRDDADHRNRVVALELEEPEVAARLDRHPIVLGGLEDIGVLHELGVPPSAPAELAQF